MSILVLQAFRQGTMIWYRHDPTEECKLEIHWQQIINTTSFQRIMSHSIGNSANNMVSMYETYPNITYIWLVKSRITKIPTQNQTSNFSLLIEKRSRGALSSLHFNAGYGSRCMEICSTLPNDYGQHFRCLFVIVATLYNTCIVLLQLELVFLLSW